MKKHADRELSDAVEYNNFVAQVSKLPYRRISDVICAGEKLAKGGINTADIADVLELLSAKTNGQFTTIVDYFLAMVADESAVRLHGVSPSGDCYAFARQLVQFYTTPANDELQMLGAVFASPRATYQDVRTEVQRLLVRRRDYGNSPPRQFFRGYRRTHKPVTPLVG